jgi:uncharacterized membrane protein YhaH (DUF805 family)
MSAPHTYPPGGFLTVPLTYLQGAPVSFSEAVKQAFRNGLVLRGRASRSAFWWFALFQGIVFALVFAVSIPLTGGNGTNEGSGASFALAVIIGIPLLYLQVVAWTLWLRRLHDTDRSGWWLLIVFVPYLGAIVLLIFTLLKGTPGPNRYQP